MQSDNSAGNDGREWFGEPEVREKVWRFVKGLVGKRHRGDIDADEIVQEAYEHCLANFDPSAGDPNAPKRHKVTRYLKETAVLKLKEHCRRRDKLPQSVDPLTPHALDAAEPRTSGDPAAPDGGHYDRATPDGGYYWRKRKDRGRGREGLPTAQQEEEGRQQPEGMWEKVPVMDREERERLQREANQIMGQLRDLLGRLKPDDRRVIDWWFFQGGSSGTDAIRQRVKRALDRGGEEFAKEFGNSAGEPREALKRALDALRRMVRKGEVSYSGELSVAMNDDFRLCLSMMYLQAIEDADYGTIAAIGEYALDDGHLAETLDALDEEIEPMQEDLVYLYRDFIESIKRARSEKPLATEAFQELSAPFLVRISDEYQSARPRIAIVGQETCGWEWSLQEFLDNKSIDDALRMFEEFDFGREYRKTPFWNYFHYIRREIFAQDDPRAIIVWLNLFKFNHDSGDGVLPMPWSPHKDAALVLQRDLFQREVAVAKPDVMIFFTGPNYDEVIQRFYPGIQFRPLLPTHPVRQAAQLFDADRPDVLSFRTYHPGYMCRHRKRMDPVLNEVITSIRQKFRGSV